MRDTLFSFRQKYLGAPLMFRYSRNWIQYVGAWNGRQPVELVFLRRLMRR